MENQSFNGEIREIYSIIAWEHPSQIPHAGEKITHASMARAACNDSTKASLDCELSNALTLEDNQDPKLRLVHLEQLLDSGADVNLRVKIRLPQVRLHQHQPSAVYCVPVVAAEICTNKSIAAIILLLSRGADVSHPSILPLAARFGDYQILELILKQRGSDPNRLAPSDWPQAYQGNALTLLCRDYFNGAALRLLLEAGADPNQVSYYGETALFTAVFFGFDEYADILLAHGASVFIHGGTFRNVLQCASAGPRPSLYCVDELLRRGCPVNEAGGYFGTALSAAAAQGHVKVAELLLLADGDPNEDGGTGKGPLDWLGKRNPINPRYTTNQEELQDINQMLLRAGARQLGTPSNTGIILGKREEGISRSAGLLQRLKPSHPITGMVSDEELRITEPSRT